MRHKLLFILIFAFCCPMSVNVAFQTTADVAASYDVVHYDADINLDLAAQTLVGREAVQLTNRGGDVSQIEFDASEIVVDEASENEQALKFETSARKLLVHLTRPLKNGETRTLNFRYHARPTRGVRFFPDQVYAFYNTSRWLVCHFDPGDKATLALKLTLPAGMKVVANGKLIEQTALRGNQIKYTWRQAAPAPTYIYGFAAGKFQEVVNQHGNVQLRFLAPDAYSPAQLTQIFADTSDMLDFYEQRAGVRYPDAVYTQVLASGNLIGQELSSFTLLPEAYGRDVLADARENNLGAHELAHQWWGNNVTCASWADFWLNEGMATFMAAAYQEHRFGRAFYEREIERRKQSYLRLKASGKDRPLAYTHRIKEAEAGGAIVYDKGALVLHLLRRQIGESAFWNGLQRYTQANFNRGVTTKDLQTAMEQACGASLEKFFAEWVYQA